jgi:hypothetical protein
MVDVIKKLLNQGFIFDKFEVIITKLSFAIVTWLTVTECLYHR